MPFSKLTVKQKSAYLFISALHLISVYLYYADSLQAQLINMGVIPILVKLLGIHSHNTALTEMCLIAFGNLAELGEYNLNTLTQTK